MADKRIIVSDAISLWLYADPPDPDPGSETNTPKIERGWERTERRDREREKGEGKGEGEGRREREKGEGVGRGRW